MTSPSPPLLTPPVSPSADPLPDALYVVLFGFAFIVCVASLFAACIVWRRHRFEATANTSHACERDIQISMQPADAMRLPPNVALEVKIINKAGDEFNLEGHEELARAIPAVLSPLPDISPPTSKAVAGDKSDLAESKALEVHKGMPCTVPSAAPPQMPGFSHRQLDKPPTEQKFLEMCSAGGAVVTPTLEALTTPPSATILPSLPPPPYHL